MEYLETIAEDISWYIIENFDKIETMTQSELRHELFKFMQNQ